MLVLAMFLGWWRVVLIGVSLELMRVLDLTDRTGI